MKLAIRSYMERCLLIFVVSAAAITVVASCQPNRDMSLLTDEPCAAPCWQRIVPGVSTAEDARRVLETCVYVSEGSYSEERQGRQTKLLLWHPADCPECLNSITFQDDVVFTINLKVTYSLKAEQILEKYGPPEGMTVGIGGLPEWQYIAVGMHYPSKGLTFVASVPLQEPRIEPTTVIASASYYSPTSFDDPTFMGPDFLHLVKPWQGYGELEVPEE